LSDEDRASEYGVTYGDLNRFLAAKGHLAPCGACGSDKWIIPLAPGFADGDEAGIVQLAGIRGIGIKGSLLVNTLVCDDCGRVEFVSAVHVKKWLDANG